ncbi:kelch-like protein 10 [Brienomyrus brachyistius]|uniref:kelch-like protein 10 n=1 Tax=Brienomyrus brachyistius TaxID=42636 RepID=UPI0020B19FB5|nr:kelch-like protein 10 [Brienomyrus brachyistius]
MNAQSTSKEMNSYDMEREIMSEAFGIFNDLRQTGALCDAVIVVNGVKFTVHKIILCGCSTYFRALFASGWNVKGKDEYIIPGISPEAMKLVIDYAYTHSVLVTADNVESLLAAADQLNIPSIMEHCNNFLQDQLCRDNCVGIFIIADVYHLSELRESAFFFMVKNFKQVASSSEEFLQLTVEQLSSVVEKDELNVSQEEVVFDAILRWIAHEPSSRNCHIAVLLPKVRLARLNEEYLMKTVIKNDLVKASKECRRIVSDALKAVYDLDITGPPGSDFENPLTRPRLPSEILLAIGGWTESPASQVTAYDTRADRWADVALEHESPLSYHGSVYLDGFVYCIGGTDGLVCSNSVRRFNPFTRTWDRVAPMQTRRCYVSVAVADGYIYAFGGFDGLTRLNTAERYDPASNSWTFIQPMQERRSDASATTLHGKIYVCGGYNGNTTVQTAECYDPVTEQWTTIAPMRTPRHGVGVISFKDKVYAVGGTFQYRHLRSVEAYDPVTNCWQAVKPMHNTRSNFGIEVIDDLLFVVGGYTGSRTTKVECFDAETGTWYAAQDMCCSRSSLSCCVVPALPSMVE